ncbi:MAG: translocation/assembly module TamB domain-containing protein [Deltaproteobacteria bacterium]
MTLVHSGRHPPSQRPPTLRPSTQRPARDAGRWVARVLCALFALIGLIPPLLGSLTRWQPVQDWAASATARILSQQLGLSATYKVNVSLWPVSLELRDVTLSSDDGGAPALRTPRLTIRPRLFSLLAGRIDAGQIAIEQPELRLVVKDGRIQNLDLRPQSGPGSTGPLPIASLAITDARVSAEIEGVQLQSDAIDLDVFADGPNTFEVALRAAASSIVQERTVAGASPAPLAVDEDVLCQLDARVRVAPGDILIRRLSLFGSVDRDPAPGTAPACELEGIHNDPGRVLMRLSGVRIEDPSGSARRIGGHVLLQAPLDLSSRYTSGTPVSGWLQVSGELDISSRHRFPEFHGKVRTGPIHLLGYSLVEHADAELHLISDRLVVSSFRAGYADGDVLLEDIDVDLASPSMPLHVRRTVGTGLTFPGLMRDIDVTPNTIVNWDLNRVVVDDFKGTLIPAALAGKLSVETRNFEIFDRSVHDPSKKHMLGVPRAQVSGTFGVHQDSVRFDDMRVDFGKSVLRTNVRIGYDNTIQLVVPDGTSLELADVSPLVDIPMQGQTHFDVRMSGNMSDPVLTGSLGITDLWFAGFPIGNLTTQSLRFVPLVVDLENARLTKGKSEFDLGKAHLDFGTDATVVASAAVQSQRFDVRDFFEMFHFDADPRWDSIFGRGKIKGRLEYVLGGKQDRCKSGNLQVRGDLDLTTLGMFEESYQKASSSFNFNWFDIDASYLGMQLDVPSLVLRKGPGSLLGSVRIAPGGRVAGELIATQIPVSEVQGLGPLGKQAAGTLSAEAEISGTLDALAARVKARISPVRIGRSELPASTLAISLVPIEHTPERLGTTACGAPLSGKFDRAEYDADHPSGVFQTTGSLFGGQVKLDQFEITRQQNKHVRGGVTFQNLDLVALSSLAPRLSVLDADFKAELDGKLALSELAMQAPLSATGTFRLSRLELKAGGTQVSASGPTELRLAAGTLEVPGLTLQAKAESGPTARFSLGGKLTGLGTRAQADLRFTLEPTALDGFVGLIPGAERARGQLGGQISVTGALDAPVYRGGFELANGSVHLRGSPQSISELDLTIKVMPGELIIEQGEFSIGGGRVRLRGNAPLTGFHLGELRAFITARNVALPLAPGVHATADADLRARWQPGGAPGDAQKRTLPQLVGNVMLSSFTYSRPVKMAVNITDLAQRGRRTEFDAYQPEGDMVSFDLNVRSSKPLLLDNNLIDASLSIEDDILQLAGTNQRFGIRGALRIAPGGHVRLTRNEFEIQQGRVRFDDPTRIAPLVDVTAVTEFRRYGVTGDVNSGSTQSNAATSGDWRVSMHAHGDAETLRIDLTSQPALPQDDIFLLLTLGLTRTELDQLQSSSVGESVALEALGALTGADQAVTNAIPVIDEFRLGSYASRSGRTEPAITIGKRLSDRIRAFVTSGLSESRDVRSNVEIKLNPKLSIEGSYDNINDASSSTIGNLGADLRWRLDFQ